MVTTAVLVGSFLAVIFARPFAQNANRTGHPAPLDCGACRAAGEYENKWSPFDSPRSGSLRAGSRLRESFMRERFDSLGMTIPERDDRDTLRRLRECP